MTKEEYPYVQVECKVKSINKKETGFELFYDGERHIIEYQIFKFLINKDLTINQINKLVNFEDLEYIKVEQYFI